MASMGPLFFRAENCRESSGRDIPSRASMGPLFFRAENLAPVDTHGVGLDASMGPLFFRAENWSAPQSDTTATSLQWGRSFSERRTATSEAEVVTLYQKLQWGRSFSERRTRIVRPASRSLRSFNGAALFQSGERPLGHWKDVDSPASMGPLFFRAENLGHLASR